MWQPISTAPFERDLELAVIRGRRAPRARLPLPADSGRMEECRIEEGDRREPDPLARMGQKALNPFSFFGDFRQLRLFLAEQTGD